jgi:nucleotidyltransferase/DNA polymerase involved in DNA repair
MFATIFVPNFHLQAALRHKTPDRPAAGFYSVSKLFETGPLNSAHNESLGLTEKAEPVALIDERENKPVIIQMNGAAQAAGILHGMTPSQALARCLSLVIKPRSHAQEKTIQEIVLHYAFSLSPFVEVTAPGVCTIQFRQTRELFTKVSRAINQLTACEIFAQAALAPSPDTSFLAAHLARPVLQIDRPEEFLGPLSIDTLRLLFN